jgi:hypothetical protein
MYTVQHADMRASASIGARYAIHADSEARADRRAEFSAGRAEATMLRLDANHRDTLRTEAYRLGHTFETDYAKAMTAQETYGPDGTVTGVKKPAAISDPKLKQSLSTALTRITKDADPMGLAQHIADTVFKADDPASATAKSLLTDRAAYAEAMRKSQGLPIMARPEEYYSALDKQTQDRLMKAIPPSVQRSIAGLPSDAQEMLRGEIGSGKTLPQIKAEISASASPIKDQLLGALSGTPSAKPRPSTTPPLQRMSLGDTPF